MILYRNNDQIIELPGLRSGLDETQYKNAATCSATLYDKDGTPVDGFINITLIYQSTAPVAGTYRGQISEAFAPPIAKNYVLKVHADQAGDDFNRVITKVQVADRPNDI